MTMEAENAEKKRNDTTENSGNRETIKGNGEKKSD